MAACQTVLVLVTGETVIGTYLTFASKSVFEETVWTGSDTAEIEGEVATLIARSTQII